MQKDHYAIKMINSKKCIIQQVDEMTKNHCQNDSSHTFGAVIHEQVHKKCPVAVFEKYLEKLNTSSPYLWQLPHQLIHIKEGGPWYDGMSKSVGKGPSESF